MSDRTFEGTKGGWRRVLAQTLVSALDAASRRVVSKPLIPTSVHVGDSELRVC
jgi:hypothetical protein